MSITYQLKPDERLVILVHAGAVTDAEFLSFYKALYEETQFDNSFNLLVDLRQTESSVRSSIALNELADFMRRQYVNTTARPKVTEWCWYIYCCYATIYIIGHYGTAHGSRKRCAF